MNRFNRTSIALPARAHTHVHLFMHMICLSFYKSQYFYEIRFQEWAGFTHFSLTRLNCALLQEYRLETTIRTCNIKALRFQRLSFTANFRSPGSYVSRQLIKGCFHPHLPIQRPRSSLTTTGLLLSEIPLT